MADAHHHHPEVAERRWRYLNLGFTAGAGLRLAAAALFMVAAIGAALVVADGGGHPAPAAAAPAAAPATSAIRCTLEIESTYAVRRWTLLSDGKPLVVTKDAPRLWRGEATMGATIMVEAEGADPLDGALTALRIEFHAGDWSHRVEVWGRGSISTTVTWPRAAPTMVKP